MHLKELTITEFDNFVKTNPIGSYHQSSSYALFMAENNYEYDLIGLIDELGVIRGATLILIKKINFTAKYGYAPKGFIIDYFDYNLLAIFTEKLKERYEKKLVFIKINPEIAIGTINPLTKEITYNQNLIIRDYLTTLGLTKLRDNLYFESSLPRFNAIVNLKNYSFANLSKNTKNKIRKAKKKGLTFYSSTNHEDLKILFEFIKKQKNVDEFYYQNYYNVFAKTNQANLFLVKIDYSKYLLASKELYDQELVKNSKLAYLIQTNPSDLNINQKMESDRLLLNYKNDIEIATLGLKEEKSTFIAAAFTIKYQNRVNIVISGIDKRYKQFNPNYFLYYQIIEYFKDNMKFLDLNGLTGDFSKSNPYYGLNVFKEGFKPNMYEFIGEFDFIFNQKLYHQLNKKGLLAREFNHNLKN